MPAPVFFCTADDALTPFTICFSSVSLVLSEYVTFCVVYMCIHCVYVYSYMKVYLRPSIKWYMLVCFCVCGVYVHMCMYMYVYMVLEYVCKV